MDTHSLPLEAFISVDVETAGPNPGDYSLLTIGACTITEPQHTYYAELRPVNNRFVPEALAISRLSMERLAERGLSPKTALAQFEDWLKEQAPGNQKPVFVAFNAPFDWMFLNDYFHRFLGRNPFGHTALDIKSFYMGLTGVPWEETSMQYVSARYLGNQQLTHHALRDAMDQAMIFRKMLAQARDHTSLPD
jgi:DNA polymerase III epsilon subunit-like protein